MTPEQPQDILEKELSLPLPLGSVSGPGVPRPPKTEEAEASLTFPGTPFTSPSAKPSGGEKGQKASLDFDLPPLAEKARPPAIGKPRPADPNEKAATEKQRLALSPSRPPETPSTRDSQSRLPKRVDRQGKAVERPRLAQGRESAQTEETAPTGRRRKGFGTLALPLGSAVAGGLLAYWLT